MKEAKHDHTYTYGKQSALSKTSLTTLLDSSLSIAPHLSTQLTSHLHPPARLIFMIISDHPSPVCCLCCRRTTTKRRARHTPTLVPAYTGRGPTRKPKEQRQKSGTPISMRTVATASVGGTPPYRHQPCCSPLSAERKARRSFTTHLPPYYQITNPATSLQNPLAFCTPQKIKDSCVFSIPPPLPLLFSCFRLFVCSGSPCFGFHFKAQH